MPNYYLSVLYKHIIQVENKNVGLKVGGHKHTFAPPIKKVGGGAYAPLAPPLPTPVVNIISDEHYIRLKKRTIFCTHAHNKIEIISPKIIALRSSRNKTRNSFGVNRV